MPSSDCQKGKAKKTPYRQCGERDSFHGENKRLNDCRLLTESVALRRKWNNILEALLTQRSGSRESKLFQIKALIQTISGEGKPRGPAGSNQLW